MELVRVTKVSCLLNLESCVQCAMLSGFHCSSLYSYFYLRDFLKDPHNFDPSIDMNDCHYAHSYSRLLISKAGSQHSPSIFVLQPDSQCDTKWRMSRKHSHIPTPTDSSSTATLLSSQLSFTCSSDSAIRSAVPSATEVHGPGENYFLSLYQRIFHLFIKSQLCFSWCPWRVKTKQNPFFTLQPEWFFI